MRSRAETTILVVDDDNDIREVLAELLRDEGYTVESACNGREALDLIDAVKPSVILLDLMMPVMGGSEFLEHLASSTSAVSTPVLVLTAASEKTVLPGGAQVLEIIRKPLDVAALLGSLERAIASA